MDFNNDLQEETNELKFETKRTKAEFCPCGFENKTHFAPYKGYTDKGYCYKCEKTFFPDDIPINFYYVQCNELKEYNEKSLRAEIENSIYFIPKSQVLGVTENGCYVSEYILTKADNKLPYDKDNIKVLNEGMPLKTLQRAENSILPLSKPISYANPKTMKKSLRGYKTNHFVTFLIQLFGEEITSGLISKYFIGTSKQWQGATIFWQIDSKGEIRGGKIMLYDPKTGKRVKEPYNCITWVHTALKEPEYNLKQCLFGEHLLNDKTKPVAIVESEKTAIIASVYLPQFIWLATGAISNLKAERCNVLKGRNVVLFPDLKAFDKWNDKAKELSSITNFIVSDYLETNATETDKVEKFDLADYLIRYNYRHITEIKQENITIQAKEKEFAPITTHVKENEFLGQYTHAREKAYSTITTHAKGKEFPPITTHAENKDFVTICSHVHEDDFSFVNTHVTLLRFQQQAKAAYKKFFMGKRNPETERSYYLCWFIDMKKILNDFGITEQQFFSFAGRLQK